MFTIPLFVAALADLLGGTFWSNSDESTNDQTDRRARRLRDQTVERTR